MTQHILWFIVATTTGLIVRSDSSPDQFGPFDDMLIACDRAADLNLAAREAAGLPPMITNGPKPRATAKHRVADPVH